MSYTHLAAQWERDCGQAYTLASYPTLRQGVPVGFVDRYGAVRVETHHGEPRGDPLGRLQATVSGALDVLRDITGETRESRVLAAIAELEALEDPDDISRTVLWQLKEGRRGGEEDDDADPAETEEAESPQNDGWVRQRWLRILQPDGAVWIETSSPGEVHDAARPGWPVLRLWRRGEAEYDWRPVSAEELAQDCRAEDEFYRAALSAPTGREP